MNEQLEKELKKWEEDFNKEYKVVKKKYPHQENTLSNRNPQDDLLRKYAQKKIEILKKYNYTSEVSNEKQ